MYTYEYIHINIYIYLYTCMYLHKYMYIHTYIYTCIYICMNIYIYMYMYICINIHTYTYTHIHVHIYMYIFKYACAYIYIYIYVHAQVSICVYIYTHISSRSPSSFRGFQPKLETLREMWAFQNGSARTCSDADAAHLRKAPGVMQMRQTREMQMSNSEDACIRNWTDKIATLESRNLSAVTVISTTLTQRLCGSVWF